MGAEKLDGSFSGFRKRWCASRDVPPGSHHDRQGTLTFCGPFPWVQDAPVANHVGTITKYSLFGRSSRSRTANRYCTVGIQARIPRRRRHRAKSRRQSDGGAATVTRRRRLPTPVCFPTRLRPSEYKKVGRQQTTTTRLPINVGSLARTLAKHADASH
jgi:hypothetical protein